METVGNFDFCPGMQREGAGGRRISFLLLRRCKIVRWFCWKHTFLVPHAAASGIPWKPLSVSSAPNNVFERSRLVALREDGKEAPLFPSVFSKVKS